MFTALLFLAIAYGDHRTTLLSDTPYEGWDEVGAYNSAPLITDPVRWRVFAYGTLDTAKMVLARWYYETRDPVGRLHHFKAYSNNVPASWMQPDFDFHTRNWGDISAIDYDHFRGIADRRPFRIAREINSAFVYLLAAVLIICVTKMYGIRGIPLYLALAFLFTSADFSYASDYLLPNADCALLSFTTISVCLSAICLARPRLVLWGAILLAIGINHKVDFLLLTLPVGIAVVFAGIGLGGSVRTLIKLAGRSLLWFGVTLAATNPYLVATPRLEIGKQIAVATSLQGTVNIAHNLDVLWHFLGVNISLMPNGAEVASKTATAVCLGILLTCSLLPFLFGRHLHWRQRLAFLLIIAAVAVLFVLPLRNSAVLYGRYFLNGWGALLATASMGLCVFLLRPFRWPRVVIGIACVLLVPCSYLVALRFHEIQKGNAILLSCLDPTFHLDTRHTRNLLVIETLRVARSGGFSSVVLIDQHAYLDLRAFFERDLEPVYINADNYENVIRGLPPGRYLALFTRGTTQVEPLWAGVWPESLRRRYAGYLEFLSRNPRIWERAGPLAQLLDWAPPGRGDNMSLAVISVNQ